MNLDEPEQRETYQRAAEIADRLLAAGYPLIGFQVFDIGAKAGFALMLPDGRKWAFRVPRENLTLEAVRSMVEAYL